MKITKAQLARLQTCYAQMGSRIVGFENTREARLQWASAVLHRDVTSFSALTLDQARILIDAAQGELGGRAPLKSKPQRAQTAEAARRAGLDGRKFDTEFAAQPEMVSAELVERIQSYYQRLGWGAPQFNAWLSSRSSPLRGRHSVRTTAEANKVLWALKGMLKDAGRWADWSAA